MDEKTPSEQKYDLLFKIIMVGDSSVGKSCLLNKYIKGVFPTSSLPTIAVEFATKTIVVKDKFSVKAQIWDTAGQEKYKSITSYHYRKAVGALLVYDVTRKNSFFNAQKWLMELKQYAEPDCIILLVGNKLDLVETNEGKREVFTEEARNFADENKLIFYETSALGNIKVSEAFDTLINGNQSRNKEIYNNRLRTTNFNTSNVSGLNNGYGNMVRLSAKKLDVEESKCCSR